VSSVPRYNVLGVGVSALTLLQATQLVLAARGRRRLGYVCICTVHGVSEARADPAFRRILNRSYLTTADGMPLVWLGPRGCERVYGPDLMLATADAGRAVGLRHYLLGGAAPDVTAALASRLRERFPGIEIVGLFAPPFRPLDTDEAAALRDDIARTQPDVVWVGVGTPKQERWMAELAPQLDAGLLIGVGAAFDFVTGRIRQAPRWIRASGGEWLWRLVHEPRRLWRRYVFNNPRFVLRVLAQKTGLRRYPIDA